jgi:hypothetical protein
MRNAGSSVVSSSTSIVTVAQRQLTHDCAVKTRDLLVCLLPQVPEGHEDSERLSAMCIMSERLTRAGETRGAYRVLVGKPKRRRPLGRPRRRRKYNIKMEL